MGSHVGKEIMFAKSFAHSWCSTYFNSIPLRLGVFRPLLGGVTILVSCLLALHTHSHTYSPHHQANGPVSRSGEPVGLSEDDLGERGRMVSRCGSGYSPFTLKKCGVTGVDKANS